MTNKKKNENFHLTDEEKKKQTNEPVQLKLCLPFLVELELKQLVREQIHMMPDQDNKP